MDIQNSMRKLLHEPRREQPHVSRETYQVDRVLLQRSDNFAVMLLARLAFGWNHQRIQSALARGRNSGGVGLIRDDDSDARIRNAACIDAVCNGDEIRSASGEKHAQRFHFWETS